MDPSCSPHSPSTSSMLDTTRESSIDGLPDDLLSRVLTVATSGTSSFTSLWLLNKRWLNLVPKFQINPVTVTFDTSTRSHATSYQDSHAFDNEERALSLCAPTLSAPALFRTLSLAPSITTVSLGRYAVDFYDGAFLTSLLAACPKLSNLTVAEPRFTGAPHFVIGLESLNRFFSAASPQLRELSLSHCLGENPKLPRSIALLTSLRVLGLHCKTLRVLPDAIGELYALQELSLACPALQRLPQTFGQLKSLSHVSFLKCEKIHRLPDSMSDLLALTSLRIDGPWHVDRTIPDSVGAQLRRLQLQDYHDGQDADLRDADGQWPVGTSRDWMRLEEVTLVSCDMPSFYPDSLTSLTRLTISGACSLGALCEILPSASGLRRLTAVYVSLHALSLLTSLEHLDVLAAATEEPFPEALFSLPLLSYVKVGGVYWRAAKTFAEQMAEQQEDVAKRQEKIAERRNSSLVSRVAGPQGSSLQGRSPESAAAAAAAWDAAATARAAATAARAAATAAHAAVTAANAAPLPPLGPSLRHLDVRLCCLASSYRPRDISLSGSTGCLAPQLGSLLSLTHLSICNLNSHSRLPPTIGQLRNLRSLSLSGSLGPSLLPCSLSLLAPSLQSLSLEYAIGQPDYKDNSCICPPFLSRLTSLTHLHLVGLSIPSPSSFLTRLSSLRTLRIISNSPVDLPENLGQLAALEWLELGHSVSDGLLPESLCDLVSLRKLHLKCCNLTQLPEEVHQLSCLEELLLEGLEMDCLPSRFGYLGALKRLSVREAPGALFPDSLWGLSSLEEASLTNWQKLSYLPPSFCLLPLLHTLTITRCDNLVTLPDAFGSLLSLKRLTIDSCEVFCHLPDSFSSLASLVHLTVANCRSLSSLPEGFGSLSQLARLRLVSCSSFSHLPASFPSLPSLRVACFKGCQHLHSLPEDIGLLPRLEVLQLRNCRALKSLPRSLRSARALRHVDVYGSGLEEGEGVGVCREKVYVVCRKYRDS